jgi:hypothetical protein
MPAIRALALMGVVTLMTACASTERGATRAADLVGLWEERSPDLHQITLRSTDGKYRAKALKRYEYGTPPIAFETSGRWSVRKGKYHFTFESNSAPMWKDDVGKRAAVRITGSDANHFRYISTDGADVDERKIGPPSLARFQVLRLKRLPEEN